MLTGRNVILNIAGESKKITGKAQKEELIKLAISESLVYSNGSLDLEKNGYVHQALMRQFGENIIYSKGMVTLPDGSTYKINKDGSIEYTEILTVEQLEAKYKFVYYKNLKSAVDDLNNETTNSAEAKSSETKVGVFENEKGKNIVLIGDTIEDEEIQIRKDAILNLGGHTVTLTDNESKENGGYILICANLIIDGKIEESKIKIFSTYRTFVLAIDEPNKTLELEGLTIEGKIDVNWSSGIISSWGPSNSNLIMNNCNINVDFPNDGENAGSCCLDVEKGSSCKISNTNINCKSPKK